MVPKPGIGPLSISFIFPSDETLLTRLRTHYELILFFTFTIYELFYELILRTLSTNSLYDLIPLYLI